VHVVESGVMGLFKSVTHVPLLKGKSTALVVDTERRKKMVKVHKDKHHRLPRSKGGRNNPENTSVVPINEHRAYHQLFRNHLPKEVASILTEKWIDPAYYLVAIPRQKSRNKVVQKRGKRFLSILIELED
jgi:hypothetical protein